jgi:hypothetical protein
MSAHTDGGHLRKKHKESIKELQRTRRLLNVDLYDGLRSDANYIYLCSSYILGLAHFVYISSVQYLINNCMLLKSGAVLVYFLQIVTSL